MLCEIQRVVMFNLLPGLAPFRVRVANTALDCVINHLEQTRSREGLDF